MQQLPACELARFSASRSRMCQVHVLPVLSHRPSLCCLMSPSLSSPLVLLLVCVAPLVSLLFSCRCCNSLGRSCCFLVLLVLSPRPSLYYLLSPPQFFSPSVLLLACVARPQQPPIFLLFAFAAIFLSVGPVSCMYCPPSTTARLSRKIIMCCPSLSVAMAGASCGKAHNQVDKQKKQTWGRGGKG